MIEYAKVILWGVSFWEVLFKKELQKIIQWSDEEELAELRKYCFDKYSDMHPSLLNEVFGTSKISVAHQRINPYLSRKTMQNVNH